MLSKAGERGVENIFYGKHEALFEGWAKTILTGALAGGAAGAFGNKIGADKPAAAFKLIQSQKVLAPAFQNIWLSVAKDASKTFGRGTGTTKDEYFVPVAAIFSYSPSGMAAQIYPRPVPLERDR